MNEKQQQLTFDKGITNVPSDALCSDNALAESVGMVYDDGEHRVIQKPAQYVNSLNGTLLYVHKSNGNDMYIVLDGSSVKYGTKSGTTINIAASALTTVSGTPQVTSVGKTLIITDSTGIKYFVLHGTKYKPQPPIPEPDIEFCLGGMTTSYIGSGVDYSALCDGMTEDRYLTIKNGEQENWNNLVAGIYAKMKSVANKKVMFTRPFFVRAAVEMYDGTYEKMTNPILMMPPMKENGKFRIDQEDGGSGKAKLELWACALFYKLKTPYEGYEDLVKGVTVFISDQVETLNIVDDIPDMRSRIWDQNDNFITYYISAVTIQNLQQQSYRNQVSFLSHHEYVVDPDGETIHTWTNLPIPRPDIDVKKDLEDVSLFYKFADIGKSAMSSFNNFQSIVKSSVLDNITEQPRLDAEDYFSHSSYIPGYTYSYNSRLNLANVARTIFNGFGYFAPYNNTQVWNYRIYVKLRLSDGSDRIVLREVNSSSIKQGLWFYYPDSRASHVYIFKYDASWKCLLDEDLTEHRGLNGAYYFRGLPVDADYIEPEISSSVSENNLYTQSQITTPEELPNYIIQSEVNNPFVFRASGYFEVGVGKIIGISSITQALSQGQFGQYPLLAFSESGIWALDVASTGYYSSVRPMSREVALLDNPCITQTDGAVFFASKKGLMVVVGNQVKCVSEQLSGRTGSMVVGGTNLVTDLGNFCDFLKDAFIAYDYRDSLLWIFDGKTRGSSPAVKGRQTCYVYSIKSGTFSKYDFGDDGATPPVSIIVDNVVNNYPDYLLQAGSTIMSLTGRDDINVEAASASTYAAKILTRPMKLENALALKSIMQIRHIKDFMPYMVQETSTNPETNETTTTNVDAVGTMTLRIFASNNLNHWVELHSLRGTPWKYYRFLYNFAGLKATDRFAGTMVVTQERRTNKLR